jgi:hypothetical protein
MEKPKKPWYYTKVRNTMIWFTVVMALLLITQALKK